MRDAEFEAFDKKVNDLVNAWTEPMGIGHWRGEVAVERETTGPEIGPDFMEVAHVNVQWPYMRYRITVNAPMAFGLSDRELEQSIVHELAHILVAELVTENTPSSACERVTQMVTWALCWTRDQAVKEPFGVLREVPPSS